MPQVVKESPAVEAVQHALNFFEQPPATLSNTNLMFDERQSFADALKGFPLGGRGLAAYDKRSTQIATVSTNRYGNVQRHQLAGLYGAQPRRTAGRARLKIIAKLSNRLPQGLHGRRMHFGVNVDFAKTRLKDFGDMRVRRLARKHGLPNKLDLIRLFRASERQYFLGNVLDVRPLVESDPRKVNSACSQLRKAGLNDSHGGAKLIVDERAKAMSFIVQCRVRRDVSFARGVGQHGVSGAVFTDEQQRRVIICRPMPAEIIHVAAITDKRALQTKLAQSVGQPPLPHFAPFGREAYDRISCNVHRFKPGYSQSTNA
jgi:hypothetical protein